MHLPGIKQFQSAFKTDRQAPIMHDLAAQRRESFDLFLSLSSDVSLPGQQCFFISRVKKTAKAL